jgi:hypothetical protein
MLEQAMQSYTAVLDADASNERARAELAAIRAEAQAVP